VTTIAFVVSGEPKGQPRPRAFARKFGDKWQARVYDAGTAEAWKSQIALAVKPHLPPVPWTGPIALTVTFLFPRPKKHFRSNGAAKDDAPQYHTSKPDIENCEKALLDALTQCGLWRDDSQVCHLSSKKRYSNAADNGCGAMVRVEVLSQQPCGVHQFQEVPA
jgi:crossover junction endodeoxyribonuclease RusA